MLVALLSVAHAFDCERFRPATVASAELSGTRTASTSATTEQQRTAGSLSAQVPGMGIGGSASGEHTTASSSAHTAASAGMSGQAEFAMAPSTGFADDSWRLFNLCNAHADGYATDAEVCTAWGESLKVPDVAAFRDRCVQREAEERASRAALPAAASEASAPDPESAPQAPTPPPTLSPARFEVLEQSASNACATFTDYCYRVVCLIANTGQQGGDATVAYWLTQGSGPQLANSERIYIAAGGTAEMYWDFHEAVLMGRGATFRYRCSVTP